MHQFPSGLPIRKKAGEPTLSPLSWWFCLPPGRESQKQPIRRPGMHFGTRS